MEWSISPLGFVFPLDIYFTIPFGIKKESNKYESKDDEGKHTHHASIENHRSQKPGPHKAASLVDREGRP